MIFNIKSLSLLRSERRQRRKQWRPWFAWYPLRFNSEKVVWLEKIVRRKDYYGNWEYALTDPTMERHG